MRVPLRKSRSPAEKFQHTGEANISETGSTEMGKNSLTLPASLPPKAVQLSARWKLLSLWFLPQGTVRACRWALSFSSCTGTAKKAHFFLTPSRIKMMGRGWKNGNQGSLEVSKRCGSYEVLHGIHQEAYPQATGDVSAVDPPNRLMDAPNALCTSPTHTSSLAGSLCVYSKSFSTSFCMWLVSMHRKLAWLQDLK